MQRLIQLTHPSLQSQAGKTLTRQAARGIVLREESILLLFTERYNDFSFPGGGVDANEDLKEGLVREMQEETGASNVQLIRHYGYVEEFRPHKRDGFDLMHMTSHFFLCGIDHHLGEAKMESYEVNNGMRPVWVNLLDALAHNRAVMQRQEKTMGLSIQRETYMLEHVAEHLLEQRA